jgi:hypothetical protein
MTDGTSRVGGVESVSGVGPSRPVHPNVGREQIDLFERMIEQGHRADHEPEPELVTFLTRDEILRIEEHLPPGSTVSTIIGRPVEYHPMDASSHGRHYPPAGRGHVDEEA